MRQQPSLYNFFLFYRKGFLEIQTIILEAPALEKGLRNTGLENGIVDEVL